MNERNKEQTAPKGNGAEQLEITLIPGLRTAAETVYATKGTTLEELAETYLSKPENRAKAPYAVIAAKVNNKLEELTLPLTGPSTVEFLDMRSQAANLIYQYSLTLLYLKAIQDVMGPTRVEVENSLNKGLFTNIKLKDPITKENIAAIEDRMWQLVREDLPIERHTADRETALDELLSDELRVKVRMLQKAKDASRVKYYSLGGYRNFFYGLMVPSTRYLNLFELRKYKNGVILRFPHQSDPGKMPPYVDEKNLYGAFAEAKRWCRLMGVNYVTDLDDKIKDGRYRELIQLSEALHEKKIAEIADMITRQEKRVVLIAGPSSSGKTTFARRLCIQLKVNGLDPLYLGTDDYYIERDDTPLDEFGEKNFEDLEAIDIPLFNRQMNDLLEGKTVDIPEFDFVTGSKIFGRRLTRINQRQPIVIEGIHGLNEELTPFIPEEEKFKIYISPFTQINIDEHNRIPATDARMLRRMVRDHQFRGSSAQNTIRQWPKVRQGEDRNIFPYSNEADVLFNSVHIYELSVLKKYAEPLLSAIRPEEPEYCEAVRMLKFLKFFDVIEDDSIIVNNSIIREFIGGSIFV